MKPFRIIFVVVAWVVWLTGCSSHYHRTSERGVTLYLRKPANASVFLYTSLDGFSPKTAEHKGGFWVHRVPSNGGFIYFYKVDGKLFTPDCRFTEKDDFGFENCVYEPGL